jgi:uncharacterized protein YebE (UPF0316 family)
MSLLVNINYFDYLILPLLIFFARICDVTIGTLRIVMISKGQKKLAPILGFFEVLIWLIAIGRIMQNLDNWVCYIFYAAGFATGNYIGMILEERLAVGISRIQIITGQDATTLIQTLIKAGYGITSHPAEGGASGKMVNIIYCIVKRSELENVASIIRTHHPEAFYSFADIRYVNKDLFTPISHRLFGIRLGK